jgi:DNA polymerase V
MKIEKIFGLSELKKLKLPLFDSKISAGFPSPADDYIEKKLDLNEHLIKHPAATFFVRVSGDSMSDASIKSGDILIVDRALLPKNNSIIIAILDGEFTVKRIKIKNNEYYLEPANKKYSSIKITEDMDFESWGVVTYAIHSII